MERDAKKMHDELGLAGFRALATAAGFFQLTRELGAVGAVSDAAIERIREAMLQELLENLPRSLTGNRDYEEGLRRRLTGLLAGEESLKIDPAPAGFQVDNGQS